MVTSSGGGSSGPAALPLLGPLATSVMPKPDDGLAEFPAFHDFLTLQCNDCLTSIRVPVACGNRFCPVCSARRRATVRKKISLLIRNTSKRRGHQFSLVTLTAVSQPDARSMTDDMIKWFRALRGKKLWKQCVFGGASVIEITGEPGRWHVHIHAVIDNTYIPIGWLRAQWTKITNGSWNVDIKRIPADRAIGYLTKYLSKSEVAPAHRADAGWALKGRRLFQPFGGWHGVAVNLPKAPCPCPTCHSTAGWTADLDVGKWGIATYYQETPGGSSYIWNPF